MLRLQTRRIYHPDQRNDWRILRAWTRESVRRPKLSGSTLPPEPVGEERAGGPIRASSRTASWASSPSSIAAARGFFIEPAYLAHGQRSPLMDQLELYLTYRLADDPSSTATA